MAQSNKRYFNTYFFEDPYIEDLDYHTRYLYLTIILNPHNNLAGCYEVSINRLRQYTGMPEDKIRIGIQKLQEDRKILFTGTWLSLKNFIKNNEFNPNMCKNAFDIMKAAPKQNVIFIVADSYGIAEPWLEEFVVKVEKGINASIDSKNRNIKKKALANGNRNPVLEHNVRFDLSTFTNTILNPSKTSLQGKGSPNGSPMLTQPYAEREGEGEFKKEIEFEMEKNIKGNINIEREEEVEVCNPSSEFEGYNPHANDPNAASNFFNKFKSTTDAKKIN